MLSVMEPSFISKKPSADMLFGCRFPSSRSGGFWSASLLLLLCCLAPQPLKGVEEVEKSSAHE